MKFFIGLRNKIEHRHISSRDVDIKIFGECQSLLCNFERFITEIFGYEYAIGASLVYSLQFSNQHTSEQIKANKYALSKDIKRIYEYIEKFRTSLSDEVFSEQEYSIKLLQVPRIANTNRADTAVEFVNWDNLDDEEKAELNRLLGIIKEKTVYVEGANVGKHKLKNVIRQVNEKSSSLKINQHIAVQLWKVFKVRPIGNSSEPFETNKFYCHYDEPHNDYVYTESWISFILHLITNHSELFQNLNTLISEGKTLSITDYGGNE